MCTFKLATADIIEIISIVIITAAAVAIYILSDSPLTFTFPHCLYYDSSLSCCGRFLVGRKLLSNDGERVSAGRMLYSVLIA